MMRKRFVLFIFLMFVSSAFAHLEGGQDSTVGNYTIEVGYNVTELVEDRSTVFLLTLKQGEEVVLTKYVWVRLVNEQGDAPFIAKLYPETTGSYTFTTLFAEQGGYEMKVRFATEQGEIEHVIPLSVDSMLKDDIVSGVIFAVLFGVFLYLLIRRRNRL